MNDDGNHQHCHYYYYSIPNYNRNQEGRKWQCWYVKKYLFRWFNYVLIFEAKIHILLVRNTFIGNFTINIWMTIITKQANNTLIAGFDLNHQLNRCFGKIRAFFR